MLGFAVSSNLFGRQVIQRASGWTSADLHLAEQADFGCAIFGSRTTVRLRSRNDVTSTYLAVLLRCLPSPGPEARRAVTDFLREVLVRIANSIQLTAGLKLMTALYRRTRGDTKVRSARASALLGGRVQGAR
jgi:hypothetical protein